MGGIYFGIGDIRLSFQEATRTSRYRHISNKNAFITFSDTGEDSAFSQNYPTNLLHNFYNALTSGDSGAIVDKLREIRRTMKKMPITHCRCIYCDLAFSIFRQSQVQSPLLPFGVGLLDDITRVLETQDMQEIQRLTEQLENCFTGLESEEKSLDIVDRVRQYIDSNYHKSSLSIVELASSFGISAGHLSRNYKKESGETLLNYINAKRIEKAKVLLAGTDMPLHEIVQEIGYLGVSSFHRKFKSSVGITPGQYRDNHR